MRVLALAVFIANLCFATDDTEALLRSGVRLAGQERYGEAVALFEQYVSRRPHSFAGRYNLALALFALGRYPEARNAVTPADAATTEDRAARDYILGKIDERSGRVSEARRELTAAFEASPSSENYALDLGLFLIRRALYPDAMDVLGRAARMHSGSPYIALGLAMAQAFGGKYAEAVATCETAVARQSDLPAIGLMLAYAHYMAGDYAQAERTAAAGLRSMSPPPYVYYLHSAALLKTGSDDYDRMMREVDVASRAIPRCSLCYLLRSKIHQERGETDAAVADLEYIVNGIAPRFGPAWYRLASLYKRQGREADAAHARSRFESIKADEAEADREFGQEMLVQPSDPR